MLIGGNGRDLLVGGAGLDRLVGNGGDDILIAGTTAHDANGQALCGIYAHWVRKDLSYGERVATLSSGNYAAGFALNALTCFDDGATDVLTGSSGDDWYVANTTGRVRDRLTGNASSEVLTQLVKNGTVPSPLHHDGTSCECS